MYNESTLLSVTALKDHPSGMVCAFARYFPPPQPPHAAAGIRPLRKGRCDSARHAQGRIFGDQGCVAPLSARALSSLLVALQCNRIIRATTHRRPPQIMSRQSNLSKSAAVTGPPAEQDIPLDIPKKSKLCLEQVRSSF